MSSSIQTVTGKMLMPLNPDPGSIDVFDIAHALSMQCRWTGHCKEFYSVAQHSVLVSQHCDPKDALWGLLHDAAEAYLCDIARPVKYTPEFAAYRMAEEKLQQVIFEKFGLVGERPASVKVADVLIVSNEAAQIMYRQPSWANPDYFVEIAPLLPEAAKNVFMERYLELKGSGY